MKYSMTYISGNINNVSTVCAVQFATRRFPCFLHEFLFKLDFQWQFWNLLVMRILKHPLHIWFDEVWLSYLRLKIIDSISKTDYSSTFYWLYRNQALSSTLNISVNSSSNSKIRVSFEAALTEIFKVKDKAQFPRCQ